MTARTLPVLLLLTAAPLAAADDARIDFTRDVKPLLARHCVTCHRADKRESGLRLDLASEMVKGGDNGKAIVADKPDESLLYTALLDDGDVSRMPYEKPPLKADEIAIVKRWIAEGANIPEAELAKRDDAASDHWSFQPIRRPFPPPGPEVHPIDRFVAARLPEGLEPAAEADRATLIRRVTLDLTGLLPTPDEVDAFLRDERPDAYDRLVDRLIASPQYGERWARHWLDLARYADSNGFTIDGPRTIWPYRDWVIDAINAGTPYDEFVIEQLAGDLLPNATRDQLVATGFHRNTLVNQEGGTDPEQFRVDAVFDRVDTTGAVFLGLTVGCARCHTHKYDPITQREYFELFAFFNGTEDVKSVAPTIPLGSPEQLARQAELKRLVAKAEVALKEHDANRKSGREEWEKRALALPETDWRVTPPAKATSAGGARMNQLDNGAIFVGGDGNYPANDTYVLELVPQTPRVTAVRLETLTNPSLPKNGPGLASNGNFVLTAFEATVRTTNDSVKPIPVKFVRAIADWSQSGYPASAAIDGDPKTGWAINVGRNQGSMNVDRETVFVPERPIDVPAGGRLVVTMKHEVNEKYTVGSFRLSVTDDAIGETIVTPHVREALAENKRDAGQNAVVAAAFGGDDAGRKPLAKAVDTLKGELATLDRAIPTTMILREREQPRETHVMIRGDFLRHGDRVDPNIPAVLPPLPEGCEEPTRLDLARWLFDPANPLVARVAVNRYWQRLFGRGLVETENDFGTQGAPPSHPELLDWLASEFQRDWDVKRLHRLIVTSATYRRSTSMRPEDRELDQANKWLARQSRNRLPAESIRDACLSASGLLTTRLGGPGVYPPQPEGLRLLSQNGKPWPEDKGPNRYRRGLYTYFWRSNPYPFLLVFDGPRANTTCTRRVRSNTPLQSLTLANDRTFVELAGGLAARITSESEGDDARLRHAVRVCLSRDASPFEVRVLRDYLARQRSHFASHPDEAKALVPPTATDLPTTEAAAWTSVARVLLNLDEFITRE